MAADRLTYQVTEISSQEDLGILKVGDVVNVRATYKGGVVEREMAITCHAEACREITRSTGLPAADPLVDGCGVIVEAVRKLKGK